MPGSRLSGSLTEEDARIFAAQFPALSARGVHRISITGGEPALVLRPVGILAAAAHTNGMDCTLVTACHWARDRHAADSFVRHLPGVTSWHLSTDLYHAREVPVEFVRNAAQAAWDAAKSVVLRVNVPEHGSEEHVAFCRRLQALFPTNTPIAVQRVLKLELSVQAASAGYDIAPRTNWRCVPGGMLIKPDGSTSPCCGGLAYQDGCHPFDHGNAKLLGLTAVHHAWCSDPLLVLIRILGFWPVYSWASRFVPNLKFTPFPPRCACEYCVGLWRNKTLRTVIRALAEQAINQRATARAAMHVLGERFMSDSLIGPPKTNVGQSQAPQAVRHRAAGPAARHHPI